MISDYVPENIVPFVRCYYVGKLFLGSIDIVVCTNSGYVLEFEDHKIKKRCAIECSNAESIVPFSAYDPSCEFYMIKSPNLLLVVFRGEEMRVIETYSSVKKFCIRDFSGKGFPMVGIWTDLSESPNIITNFADKFKVPESMNTNPLSGLLTDKLQEIHILIKESERKLSERKKLRIKCSHNLEETLAKRFQPQMQEDTTPDEMLSQIHVVKYWHRTHNEKWILGATIMNGSNSLQMLKYQARLDLDKFDQGREK